MASKVSSSEALMAALRANNPFERPPVIREQNIWGESFPDVPCLNKHASDAVFEALAKVKSSDSSLDKLTSIVFTAAQGVGKSHVIKRIRKRLQSEGQALFVYVSADKFGNLDLVNCSFRQSIAASLEQTGSAEVSQWQEIAALMVANAMKASNSKAKVPSAVGLSTKFDKAYQNSRIKGRDLVADLTRAVSRSINPNADPYIIRAIIWTLSEERGSLAVKWLAGEQLDAQDAIDLRLPANQHSESESEAHALLIVSKILSIIGEYRTVFVCFDELDTLSTHNLGLTTAIVVTGLVRKLFTTLQQSEGGHGIVILTAFMIDTWSFLTQDAEVSSSRERVSSAGKAIDLKNVDSDSISELVSLWLTSFYAERDLVPPSPIYPFEAEELLNYSKGRPYVREALKWCAIQVNEKVKVFKLVPGPLPTPTERFRLAYENALEQFSDDYLEDNVAIASTLSFCFQKIIDLKSTQNVLIENVLVKGIEEVTPRSKNNGYINFKLVGVENDQPVTIGVEVLQQKNGLSVGAGFRRLLEGELFGLSRGCLVRSRQRKLKRSWDSYKHYQDLVAQGGEWIDLKTDEIKPLLALQYVYEHCEKFDLTIKRLDSFASVQKLLTKNALIREILSRPEGALAEEASEGEELQPLHSAEESQEIAANISESLEIPDAEDADDEPDLADLEVA